VNLILDRKRWYTQAKALMAGSSLPPSVIFEKLVQANTHEHGTSAAFVILRDYIFATQNNTSSSSTSSATATDQKVVVQAGGAVVAAGVKRKR
jgi:hypothetical protein